jgi:hypothetical protein
MKDLSLHVLDLLANSTAIKATKVELTIIDSIKEDKYWFQIKDNGKGMDSEFAKKVVDPYTTTRKTRKVGLGLPLIKMNSEHCNGGFNLESQIGVGTILTYWFQHSNIDRQPLGDIASAVVMTAAMNDETRLIYTHTTDLGSYTFDTKEIKEALEVTTLNDPDIIKALEEMINENLKEIKYNQ